MATIAQIRKVARKSFIDEMAKRGFPESKKSKMTFVRKYGDDIFQVIGFDVMRGGENLRIEVFCWVPEVHMTYETSEFPKGIVITTGGWLLHNEIGLGTRLWDVRKEEGFEGILSEIQAEIDRLAIPWFDAIQTREKYVEALKPDIKVRDSFEKKKADILAKVGALPILE